MRAAAIALCAFASSSHALVIAQAALSAQRRTPNPTCIEQATAMPAAGTTNVAQTLVNLHDEKQTFNFCGGMMFQIVLSDALRAHLVDVAKTGGDITLYDASKARMSTIPDYSKSAFADSTRIFHGREIRKVPTASGGMGFVLQLSLADGNDPEGWTPQEIAGYDGWGHDASRVWRTGEMLESASTEERTRAFRIVTRPANVPTSIPDSSRRGLQVLPVDIWRFGLHAPPQVLPAHGPQQRAVAVR